MRELDFCLRAQTLANDSDEIFWNGSEYLSSCSEEALACLRRSDFVYENGVIWFSAPDIGIRWHYEGWLLMDLMPIERDDADRMAPVVIVVNVNNIKEDDLKNIFSNISVVVGRTFSHGVLECACNQAEMLIKKRVGVYFLFTLVKFFILKFF